MPAEPTVRILHHMARSGGTLISKCLASMDRACLLSEIHPAGAGLIQPAQYRINPLAQAFQWHGLITQSDLGGFRTSSPTFDGVMHLIERRARERGLNLIVRDWTHLDFVGVPFCRPGYESVLPRSFAEASPCTASARCATRSIST